MDNQSLTTKMIAGLIDHSLLRPDITLDELTEGIELASKFQTANVTVKPGDVKVAREMLGESGIPLCTVIGFPHGSNTTETKVFETIEAIEAGVSEIDVVQNIGRFKSGDTNFVREDIQRVVEVSHARSATVKVILENHYLSEEEVRKACQLYDAVGVDFVKTSTGYADSGAKISDCKIMRSSVSPETQVKAAGGIRTLDQVLEYLSVGVTRIATRSTAAILEEARNREAEGKL
jgi:deoxyribose-phosphate aldolase